MIDGDVHRLIIAAILAVGLAAGLAFLLFYRPTRWLRDPTARDASGWVVVLVGLYAWSAWRVAFAWIGGTDPPDQPAGTALVSIVFGLLLDGALIFRLRRFMGSLEQDRQRPTRLCPTCRGAGVVPVEEGAS